MFSICTKGIGDCLYLIAGDGRARLMSLHSATPSFSASNKSPDGNRSPKVSSIHPLVSFAAVGVYLDMRRLRISWSKEDTEAILFRHKVFASVYASYRRLVSLNEGRSGAKAVRSSLMWA